MRDNLDRSFDPYFTVANAAESPGSLETLVLGTLWIGYGGALLPFAALLALIWPSSILWRKGSMDQQEARTLAIYARIVGKRFHDIVN